MAADEEKNNDVQAVERSDANSGEGKRLDSEWQDIGSEEKMTWKTWVVIFVGLQLPQSNSEC
jgi:hypothetical protein